MSQHVQLMLTVTEPFTDPSTGKAYVRGSHITDPGLMAVIQRDFHHHVVQHIAEPQHLDGSFHGTAPT